MIDEESNLKFWPNFRRLTGQLAKLSLKIFFDELCLKEKKIRTHLYRSNGLSDIPEDQSLEELTAWATPEIIKLLL